jgi:multisubunit Na+/H+ antiporter MnhE subunit
VPALAASTGPNWLGSPQHVVVGALLALGVSLVVRRRLGLPEWVAFALAIGAVSAAEIVWELVEYGVRYAGNFHYSAYYDTLADLASSIVGALVGAVVAVPVARALGRRRRGSG